jgi:2-dehydropantoate 2-reductase
VISFVAAPGYIRHVAESEPFVAFGELDNQPSDRTSKLLEAFEAANVMAEIPPDIEAALWQKLIIIVTHSGIGAVTRSPVGIWRAVPETRALFEKTVEEICAVARARGIAVSDDFKTTVLNWPERLEPGATMSLQRDIVEGLPSELEEQVGVVVRIGQEVGVDTLVHNFIYRCLLPGEQQARGCIAI